MYVCGVNVNEGRAAICAEGEAMRRGRGMPTNKVRRIALASDTIRGPDVRPRMPMRCANTGIIAEKWLIRLLARYFRLIEITPTSTENYRLI